jgi:hypothetical protein
VFRLKKVWVRVLRILKIYAPTFLLDSNLRKRGKGEKADQCPIPTLSRITKELLLIQKHKKEFPLTPFLLLGLVCLTLKAEFCFCKVYQTGICSNSSKPSQEKFRSLRHAWHICGGKHGSSQYRLQVCFSGGIWRCLRFTDSQTPHF